jgi:hypothetical protein
MHMTIDDVVAWSRVLLVIAAICTTSFPFLYLFSPWYRTMLGRTLMFQSAIVAITIDLKLILTIKPTRNRTFLVWFNFWVLLLITLSSAALTVLLWGLQHSRKDKEKHYG